MTRSVWMLIAVAACAAGCTPAYRVHVNTYSELGEPVGQGTAIYVSIDPNSQNPILRRQIASKIQVLLEGNGYHPVEKADAAAYLLTFELGIDSERVLDYAPVHSPFGGYYGRYGGRFGWGFGYTTYMPYIDTIYTHWLRMRLYAAQEGGRPGDQTVWLGEAITGTESPELREAVNYLLVGCMEHFGIDTEEWVTETIKRDDPRILGVTAD